MIVRLQPEQISIMWDSIKFAVLEANSIGPSQSDLFLNEVLGLLLSGKAQAWIMYEDAEGSRTIYAIVVTCFMEEPLLGYNYLLVHSVYGFKPLNLERIYEAMAAFEEFGKANGAFKIVGMTREERLLNVYERLGMEREVFVYSKNL